MLHPTRRSEISDTVRSEATIGSTVQGSQGMSVKSADSNQELWQEQRSFGTAKSLQPKGQAGCQNSGTRALFVKGEHGPRGGEALAFLFKDRHRGQSPDLKSRLEPTTSPEP